MDIAEVAKKSGLAASTLRYYEEKGLIAPTGRAGLRRTFGPGVLDQLALVALGQAAGFSLEDIRALFAAGGKARIDRRMLAAKADEIDATVKRLKAMSSSLRHAAECPAPSHAQCPTFQRLLRAAGAGKLQAAEKSAPARPRRAG